MTKENATPATGNGPGILDAVVDQFGGHWLRFGTTTRSCWFSLHELQVAEKEVLGRLSGPGMTFLTTKTKNAFKAEIESQTEYRPALVAAHPGWVGQHYVLGDGEVIAPPGDAREVIIAFEPRPKFSPKGTLQGWQEGVGPIVTGQPLALFVAAYSFVGPILRFAPPDILNPQVELVGERECGKSTLLAFAASPWAGDPDSDVGGAETWDLTINTLDPEKLAHADSLLGLDEGNLAGTDSKDQKEVIRKAVFKLASTGGRKRFTDSVAVPNVRLAMLSTSNVPLGELVSAPEAVMGALRSRMVTISVPKSSPFGVLAFVPEGFVDARTAIEALRSAANENYGEAGRAFVRELVKAAAADEKTLRDEIDKLTKRCLAELGNGGSARVRKTLAATYAAGVLARKWRVLPKAWGPLLPSLLEVYRSLSGAPAAPQSPPALERIRQYRRSNRKNLVRVSRMKAPFTERDFARKAGFLRPAPGDSTELLIPSGQFQRAFPGHRELMNSLKKAGQARTEGGKRPKLTIKAPSRVCSSGRVYCIRIRG